MTLKQEILKESKCFAAMVAGLMVVGYIFTLAIYMAFKGGLSITSGVDIEVFKAISMIGHFSILAVGWTTLCCLAMPVVLYFLKDAPLAPEDFYEPAKNKH